MNHGLLEKLTRESRAVYLSDLRMPRYRKKLVRLLTDMQASDYAFAEWRDAVAYLTGKRIAELRDGEEAKAFLIKELEA